MENPQQEKEIINGFEILEEIGRGGFSNVCLARHIKTGTYCAVKIVNLLALQDDEFVGIMREISVFSQVNHPNICHLYSLAVAHEHLYFFMECACNGTLLSKVNANHGLPEKEAHDIFVQLYSAVCYLHTHHFLIHRDLKLENVLLDSKGNVKLTDFGLSSTSYCNIMRTIVGTPGYMAPEVISGCDYDAKCDVWSLGICLYAMMTASLPFTPQNTNYRLLVDEATELHLPMSFSPDLQDLLRKMLTIRPQNRLSLQQLQSHRWLRGMQQTSSNYAPKPIVFYKVNDTSDIMKFKRKPVKVDQKIVAECVKQGIEEAVLLKDLETGVYNENTTTYFCLLYPMETRPSFEKPKQETVIPGARKRSASIERKKYSSPAKLPGRSVATASSGMMNSYSTSTLKRTAVKTIAAPNNFARKPPKFPTARRITK